MKDTANKLILGTLYKHLGNHRLNSELVRIANDITEVLVRSKQLVTDEVLPCVRFSSLKNDLLIQRQKLKDDTRMSFEEPSSWSHKITAIDAQLKLIDSIEKDEI